MIERAILHLPQRIGRIGLVISCPPAAVRRDNTRGPEPTGRRTVEVAERRHAMHFETSMSELDRLSEIRLAMLLATLDVATTSAHLQRRLLEARARPRPAQHLAAPPQVASVGKSPA
jgi:hypothetical protein